MPTHEVHSNDKKHIKITILKEQINNLMYLQFIMHFKVATEILTRDISCIVFPCSSVNSDGLID